jgi:hypothetical protein
MSGWARWWQSRCGQPGHFCQCTDRDSCGCRELHPMGSGREPDAIGAFVDAGVDGQDGLFDAGGPS